MRWILCLCWLTLATAAPVAEFTGNDAFVVDAGKGKLLVDGDALRLTVTDRELRVVSPPFAVAPWRRCRIDIEAEVPRGFDLTPHLEFQRGDTWQRQRATRGDDGWFVGIPPDVTTARVLIWPRSHGKRVGDTVTIRHVTVTDVGPLVPEAGQNLYWNGSFEIPEFGDIPAHWRKWKDTEEWRVITDGTADGDRFLRVTAERTYFFLPQAPVLPGRIYRFRVRLRGTGHCWFGIHKLGLNDPAEPRAPPQRIGWDGPLGDGIELAPEQWQTVEFLGIVDTPAIIWFEPYITYTGGTIDIDAVDLRSIDK